MLRFRIFHCFLGYRARGQFGALVGRNLEAARRDPAVQAQLSAVQAHAKGAGAAVAASIVASVRSGALAASQGLAQVAVNACVEPPPTPPPPLPTESFLLVCPTPVVHSLAPCALCCPRFFLRVSSKA